jgi:hypothetical protein
MSGEADDKFDVVCCRKFLILMVNAKFPAAFVFLMLFFLFFHQFSLVFHQFSLVFGCSSMVEGVNFAL